MKIDEHLYEMLIVTLKDVAIDYAGDDGIGDDPHSMAVKSVRSTLAELDIVKRKYFGESKL